MYAAKASRQVITENFVRAFLVNPLPINGLTLFVAWFTRREFCPGIFAQSLILSELAAVFSIYWSRFYWHKSVLRFLSVYFQQIPCLSMDCGCFWCGRKARILSGYFPSIPYFIGLSGFGPKHHICDICLHQLSTHVFFAQWGFSWEFCPGIPRILSVYPENFVRVFRDFCPRISRILSGLFYANPCAPMPRFPLNI